MPLILLIRGRIRWIKAGKLSFNLKRKGKNVNLTDCYIAVIAQEYDCQILSLDMHFKDIQKTVNIRLVAHD